MSRESIACRKLLMNLFAVWHRLARREYELIGCCLVNGRVLGMVIDWGCLFIICIYLSNFGCFDRFII